MSEIMTGVGAERRPAGRAVWLDWLLLAGVGTLVYVLVQGLTQDALYDVIRLSGGIVILLGIRFMRPEHPGPWYLLAAGQLLFGLGDVIWDVIKHSGADPFPSLADGVYLVGYAVATLGLVRLVHHSSPERDVPALIDAGILALGVGVVLWVFVAQPSAHQAEVSVATRAFTLAYPLADLILFGVAARLALLNGDWTRAHVLLLAGVAGLLASDIAFEVVQLRGTFEDGTFAGVGWLLGAALWGAAALHPSMRTLGRPRPPDAGITRPRTTALFLGSLLGPSVIGGCELVGYHVDLSVALGGTLVLLVLIWLRMRGLIRDLAGRMAADRETQVAAARGVERRRIARELHDFVTYSLGAVIVQAGGARRMLAMDPDRVDDARAAFGTIEERSREALEEMRRLLAALRDDDPTPAAGAGAGTGAPVGSRLSGLASLAAQLGAVGTDVRLDVEGDVDALPPVVDLAAFRIIQEALNNVRKHAPGAETRVRVRRSAGGLDLEIANGPGAPAALVAVPALRAAGGRAAPAPAPASGGFGVLGMRERAVFLGGSLAAGPTAAGGWSVTARLPIP